MYKCFQYYFTKTTFFFKKKEQKTNHEEIYPFNCKSVEIVIYS